MTFFLFAFDMKSAIIFLKISKNQIICKTFLSNVSTNQILIGDADMCDVGAIVRVLNGFFDLPANMAFAEIGFASRTPKPVISFGNILKPFSILVWTLAALCLITLSTFFLASYMIYTSNEIMEQDLLSRREKFYLSFYLFSFCKITEPEPLPWFDHGWSAGKFGVFLWSVFALLMTMFYNSNLRAFMIMVEYEKSLDTLDDVIANGKTPWMYKEPGTK